MKFKYNFLFGKKKRNPIQWTIISIVLSSIVLMLHNCTTINEKNLWSLIYQIQKEAIKKKIKVPEELNEYIIKTPELLDIKVKADVDYAIQEYHKKVKESYKPTYIEEKNDEYSCYSDDCKKLAPPMRMCSPFMEGINCTY